MSCERPTVTFFNMFLVIALLGMAAWMLGRDRARTVFAKANRRGHSLPSQHASYLALWTVGPAVLFMFVWPFFSDRLVMNALLSHPAAKNLPTTAIDRDALISEAMGLADGTLEAAFNPMAQELAKPIGDAINTYTMLGLGIAAALVVAGFIFGYFRIKPDFRARHKVEQVVVSSLIAASMMALVVTFGIVVSLLFETGRFFEQVPVQEFLFGTHWSPSETLVPGQPNGFGAVPLFWGTIFVGAIIAMAVATPIGVMCAIYLTQYAAPRVRSWLKPLLEILAGIPTVVYGYFAALTLGPLVRDLAVAIGMESPTSESALAAGLVMGVMIIPLISSMSDDSIAAVPSAMRDGALALGSTKAETILKVLVPAALPGIVGGVLLAVSRAIGETMIVVMAAGMAANLTANPFASVTTVTAQIVQLLTGDQEFESAKTLSAFALGLVLFIITLLLNVIAVTIVKRYREAYE